MWFGHKCYHRTLKSYLVDDWDSLFSCRCTVDLVFFFDTDPFTLEMNASAKMLPAFIFHPIVMEIHPLSPRQLRFQGEFGAIVTLLGYHIPVPPTPPTIIHPTHPCFWWKEKGGEKNLLENHKMLTHKICCLEKTSAKVKRARMTLFLWQRH